MSLNSPIPRDAAAAGMPAGPDALPEPEPAPLPASAQPSPDGGAARDLSGLAWLAPSLRSALEDAAAELGHYVDEVRQAPEALGARDTTSLRLAGQHLHQAAGAVHIVGLRGTDPYCQALRRLLDAIDAGTVAASPEALAVFRAGVQALAEYVDDLMAGDDEAPLRLFQPYAAVLARLGEERVHPADLWLDELQMLPGMLLPPKGPAAVTRARQQFESALLKALRLPTPCTDAALLREAWLPLHAALEELRANEQEARRAADHPDRGVWHVLGLVCRALALGLLPSDLLAKRFAGRANLLLRQYQQGHVRVPQALLNDAVFLLVCTGLAGGGEGNDADAAALRADIARTLVAFRLDAAHAQAYADFRLRYYGWLDPIDTRNLQQAAAGLERAAAADQAAWEIALAALAEAAQPLAQPALQRCLAQAAMPGRERDAGDAGDALGAAGIALFLSRALALPWRVHGQSAHAAASHFAAQCDALAACLADPAAAAPAWLARMVDEARAQAQRSEAVTQLRAQLDSGESWLDSYDRNAARPDGAAHLRDARQAFAALAGTLAQLRASSALPGALAGEAAQAGAAVEAVKTRLADEGELADAGARAALLRTVAAELGVVHAFADALEFGRARHAEALPDVAAAGDAHAPQDPLDAARAAADEALRAGAVSDAPAVQRLRAALQALADQAAIDDDAALRRLAADAVTQCNAWLAGSDDAGARMVMALAAMPAEPAPVPAVATTPSTPSMPAAGDHAAIDAELLDIFLNEADEVLGGIAGDLGAGVEALRDADMLSRLRRAFHTLKGSSRMVGLHRYGEAAWAVEQVMNLWLAEAREPAPALLTLLRRAHAELSAWVARLHGDAAAWHDIAPLVAAAEAVRDAGTAVDMAQAAPDVVAEDVPNEHPDAAATDAATDAATEAGKDVDTDASADTGTPDGNVLPFRLAGGLSDEDDHYKVIGPVRIGLALYNVYLQEADGLLRQFATDISEWRHEAHPCPSELALRVAHTLQGSASTVGLEPVREIAEALEALLLQLGSHPVAMHAGDFRLLEQAAERMRGMLHQFAAGIWPQADAALRRSLVEFGERALLRPRVALPAPPPAEADDAMAQAMAQVFGRLPPAAQSTPDVPPADEAGATPAAPPVTAQDAVVIALPTVPRAPEAPADDAGTAPDPALVQIFLEEAQGSLPELGKLLRGWEAAPDDARHGGLVLRALHTLKGSARMAGAMALGQAAHEMETLLDGTLRAQGQQPVAPKVFERLYAWYDRILAHAEALQAGRLLPADEADVVNGLAEDAEPAGASTAAESVPELPAAPGPSDVMVPMPPAAPLAPLAPLASAEPQRALVRVQARALDTLINEAGEVGATRARLDSELESMRAYLGELNDNVARLRGQLREIEIQAESQMASRIADAQHKQEFDPLEFDRFTRFQELTRMMAESVNDVATVEQNLQRGFDRAASDLAAQARLTRGLQRGLMQARMVQFDALAERLYRVARQAAAETGKEVRLLIKGGTVEIDRSVLDRMAGPIEHLIRNGVAHGIEPAAQRRAAGKPATGALTLEVQQEGNEVVLHFIDDGGGLDLARIRARAVERRLLAPDDDASEARLTEMIFTPGFSTAEAVSELAGRGVGMDVVRAETVALGGRITLASQPGQGTTFTVHLPLTTAITQVLVIALGARRYAVPSGMIDQVQQLRAPALLDAYNHGRLAVAGAEVPFFYFGALLEQGEAAPAGRKYSPVVVVRSGAERVAVHVDDVVGNREVVVKHIGPHLARLEGIAGATTLGDGEIVLIYNPVVLAQRFVRERGRSLPLDPPALPQATQQPAVAPQPGAVAELAGDGTAEPVAGLAAQPTVMVVDDSLTVRKATQRLLGRAGYHVVLARDGVDALKQLQDVMPDAMLVDIEMPHMDGFDLTRNVRSDARTAHLPLVMITSRTADKHRRYAEEIGVNVYLGKPYNEDELLGTLHRLLGERAAGTAGSVAQMLGDGQAG
ncbi:Response regulator receiver of TWO COMPONENT REGULATORY system (SENSOR HISTIDINE KINASE AND RESPONSE REGULATOR HYBRID) TRANSCRIPTION REGULATOR PROTEIN [Cupriavidus taiwanensis]|uniref:hybrid sensor histidine kinase/response regulator n=1 Tax=Cupriavidus taiwanensis TaxID=164546 RepID=UPI000E17D2A5|nr:Hpt domain-containing protein [Cupriavidus taiwanensis]SOZ15414.1 Response regulator receiver of TWO COMPONENT REGULATORY system (SENSOR HISTIDINE KINASE AND RESPONSE REGULATOR HYBRID) TRANSCRIPTION REGULATOR PROTEIN [Cupriavidus taiwanensis]SOZ27657.1 Response regulator receiver of TWO COMPONENT REGULATORY system (SENSOR HISTIDINE KINASE AND RESPONSE REGULATOR HYBRID) TRANSCRIPTION REGULATOR PROTEIN [Cupriavidus taiwanensis]SOZ45984.1 Response regulator receiver of TWO COMPONENT REGULATORY s